MLNKLKKKPNIKNDVIIYNMSQGLKNLVPTKMVLTNTSHFSFLHHHFIRREPQMENYTQ